MTGLYMLDTNICSFIMRQRPPQVIASLAEHAGRGDRIVVSAVTYAEMRFGAVGKKASQKHAPMVDAFVLRLDGVLPWDSAAIDEATRLRVDLAAKGTPISDNDVSIAGHALTSGATLVTNNRREFDRITGLRIEDWAE